MGGPSQKTEKDHQEVISLYDKCMADCRSQKKEIRTGELYKKVADSMGYAPVTVRSIISNYFKNRTTRKSS